MQEQLGAPAKLVPKRGHKPEPSTDLEVSASSATIYCHTACARAEPRSQGLMGSSTWPLSFNVGYCRKPWAFIFDCSEGCPSRAGMVDDMW